MKKIALFLVVLLSGCGNSPGERFLGDDYSVCLRPGSAVQVKIKKGIDASSGEISMGGEKLGITIDPFVYYPVIEKVDTASSRKDKVVILDSGEYGGIDGIKKSMSLAVYQEKGLDLFLVLSGSAGDAGAKAIKEFNDRLCVCGHC